MSTREHRPVLRSAVPTQPANQPTDLPTRPPARRAGDTEIIESAPPQTVVVHEPKRQLDLTPFTESHYFVFDHSFDHLAPNEQVGRWVL